jgi:hypothetical protein
MFSDASGVGYGGYIAKEAGKSMLGEVYGAWDAPEAMLSASVLLSLGIHCDDIEISFSTQVS